MKNRYNVDISYFQKELDKLKESLSYRTSEELVRYLEALVDVAKDQGKLTNEELLSSHEWEIECENPLEIRNTDGSFATKAAAEMVISILRNKEK